MVDLSKMKPGFSVVVEDGHFLVPGIIMIIDIERGEVGVKEVFSGDTKRFTAEQVHTRYPRPNGHQPEFSALARPSPKDKNLLHLLGGFIVTLSKGETSPAIINEVVEEIKKAGISREGVRAQEVIANIR